MRRLCHFAGTLGIAVVATGWSWSAPRTWTATDGRTVEAEYRGVSGSGAELKVLLNVIGRGTIPFPLSSLSEADRKWVEEQRSPAKTSTTGGESGGTKAILGKWEGFMAASDGSPQGRLHLEITEDLITATNPSGQLMGTGTYKIRGDSAEMQIDTDGTSGTYEGKSYEGIIKVEGATLKWCSTNDNPAAKRPREFKTDTQQYHFLMVLEKK